MLKDNTLYFAQLQMGVVSIGICSKTVTFCIINEYPFSESFVIFYVEMNFISLILSL